MNYNPLDIMFFDSGGRQALPLLLPGLKDDSRQRVAVLALVARDGEPAWWIPAPAGGTVPVAFLRVQWRSPAPLSPVIALIHPTTTPPDNGEPVVLIHALGVRTAILSQVAQDIEAIISRWIQRKAGRKPQPIDEKYARVQAAVEQCVLDGIMRPKASDLITYFEPRPDKRRTRRSDDEREASMRTLDAYLKALDPFYTFPDDYLDDLPEGD